MKKQPYEFVVEKTSTGYSAYCEIVSGFTTGANIDELKTNIVEMLNLALSETDEIVTLENIRLTCDLKSFFALAQLAPLSESEPGRDDQTVRAIREVGRELTEIGCTRVIPHT